MEKGKPGLMYTPDTRPEPDGTEPAPSPSYRYTDPKKATEINDLKELHQKLITEFKERFWKSAVENKRFRMGEHWDEDEKSEIDEQELIAYSLALAGTKMTINISQQMANRQEFRCLGRGLEDEVNAELKTYLLKFVDDDNDFEYVESDVYADGIAKKYGVIKRYTDYSEDANGKIVLKRIPYNQVMWDINCTDYNIPKYAKFMQEYDYFTREELREMYPDKKAEIDKIEDSNWQGLQEGSSNKVDWYRYDQGLRTVKRVVHYQRRFKTVYSRIMSDNSVVMSDVPFSPDEEILRSNYNDAEDRLEINTAQQEVTLTVIKEIPRIKQYIEAVVFTEALPEELDRFILGIETPEGEFMESSMHCLHPYYSFFDDGDVICLMDYIKQPQKFLDRLTMQIDKSMSKMIKSSYTYVKSLLEQESIDNWETLSEELVSGGALLSVKEHGAIKSIDTGIITPELFTMWQFMYKVLEDITGGRNVAGLKETANESGIAVQQRKEAAFAVTYLYIDNLRRWKKTLGEGLMENIDEVYGWNKKATFRILGDSLSEQVIEILKKEQIYQGSGMPYGYGYVSLENLSKPLGETKVDIIISRAPTTPHQKEQKFNQLINWYALKAKNGERTPPLSTLFPFVDYDPTVKAAIKKWEEKEAQREADMMELEKKKLEFQGNMEISKAAMEANKSLKEPQVEKMTASTGNDNNYYRKLNSDR